MIWWHRVGQKVFYRDAELHPDSIVFEDDPLQQGEIYTIANVVVKSVGVCFQILESNHPRFFWKACRFEPVFPQAVEDLRRLTSPTPEQKLAVFEEMVAERLREAEEA